MSILNLSPSAVTPPTDNMEHGRCYSFYLRRNDANSTAVPRLYGNLIASATAKIKVWDPYIHDEDMKIFANLNYPVDITILTLCSLQRWTHKCSNVETKIKEFVPTEFLANTSFEMLYINKDRYGADINGAWQFHDRFLMIDDSDFFIIGSSVAHHLSSMQSTGIMRIEYEEDKDVIRNAFNETYNVAISEGCTYFLPNLL